VYIAILVGISFRKISDMADFLPKKIEEPPRNPPEIHPERYAFAYRGSSAVFQFLRKIE